MTDHRLWPGKSQPLPGAKHLWHPATFHCLDVMACALALMDDGGNRLQRVAQLYAQEVPSLRRVFAFLIGLHDIGKLSEKFATDIGHEAPISCIGNRRSHLRHWQISAALLRGPLDAPVQKIIGVERGPARKQLYAAVSGHHGKAPQEGDLHGFDDLAGLDAAGAFINDLNALLEPAAPLNLRQKEAAGLSWSLAGLTVVADWLGSNQTWFPYTSPETDVNDYWAMARHRASTALTESGLRRSRLSELTGLGALFGLNSARPMQAATSSVELPKGPTLAIVEDATGSGKTEAAIVLAHRMMAARKGEGQSAF